MQKKKVRVYIEGRNYSLISDEDPRYVHQIADEVKAHMHKSANGATKLDARDCAVLAALDFCDERNKALKRNQDVIKKADQIIHQTNDLNKLCAEYKEKLTEAINENTRLSKRIRALERQLETLISENKQLKKNTPEPEKTEQQKKTAEDKKNEKLMGYVPMQQYSLFEDESKNAKQKN